MTGNQLCSDGRLGGQRGHSITMRTPERGHYVQSQCDTPRLQEGRTFRPGAALSGGRALRQNIASIQLVSPPHLNCWSGAHFSWTPQLHGSSSRVQERATRHALQQRPCTPCLAGSPFSRGERSKNPLGQIALREGVVMGCLCSATIRV